MRKAARTRSFFWPARGGFLVLLGSIGVAHADQRTRAEDVQETDVGRKRFAEGVTALKNGKYEEARISFQQSYALKPVPAALRNLAATELRTGRYVEAARHFTSYLKTTKGTEIDRADLVHQGLAEAKSHCAVLIVEANVPGAEIAIDGETIGHTPLRSDPWIAEPGEHTVTVHLDGYEDRTEKPSLEAGRTLRIFVTLKPNGLATSSGIFAEASPPRRSASSSDGLSPAYAEESRSSSSSPPSREGASRVSPVPIAIGGALTIAGLAVGIGETFASNGTRRDRDALLASIPGTSPKCGNGTPYGGACDQVHGLDDKSASQRKLATAGFIGAGVAGAATIVYWLWPRASRSQGMVVPTVAPAYGGIQLWSAF